MITRKEAEKLCREVIASHAGEALPENLFNDSVDMLMKEANKDVPCETNEDDTGFYT